MRWFHFIIATGIGVGYSPLAPGTAGSAMGWMLAFFVFKANVIFLLSFTITFFIVGVLSSNFLEKELNIVDPPIVVIDEIVGMWIGLFLLPLNLKYYLLAFILFRFFDIIKPFPIGSMQKLHGGWGIMLDDVTAGVYSFLTIHLLRGIIH